MAKDVAERVADELAAWLETRSTQVANAVLESVYRPRVVEPTRAESVAIWRPLLVTPEGFLNEQGKQQIIAQVGGLAYEEIARSVARAITAEKDAILAEAPAPGPQVDRFGPGVPTLQGRNPATAPAPEEG